MSTKWIENSKFFADSKNKTKILAAVNSPINQKLVQQLQSYVDPEYLDEEKLRESSPESSDSVDVEDKPKGTESEKGPSGSMHPKGAHTRPATSFSPSPKSSPESQEDEDTEELPESEDTGEPEVSDDEVAETTKLQSSQISASTYVTVETVSQAAQEIPGMLNLREETSGATYAAIKSGASSELWVYYEAGVDLNKLLENVNQAIVNSGYYFLEFNRVSRDDNAIIFTINWISSYFHPSQLVGDLNE